MKLLQAILIMIFCILSVSLDAQDPRFSQFYQGPLHLNPALTGVFNGQMRVAINYRDQWTSILGAVPFRTIGASIEYRYNTWGNDYLATGISVLRDEAGDAHFNQLMGNLSLSYVKQISGGGYKSVDQFLVAGAQGGLGQHSLDWSRLWFTRQFDVNAQDVNTMLDPGENLSDNSDLYVNVNAGLLWYAIFNENANAYAGLAAHHVNTPSVKIGSGDEELLYRRLVVHAGGELPFNDEISLLPSVLFMTQGPAMETVVGTNVRYSNNDWYEVAVRIGAWPRLTNSVNNGLSMESIVITTILEIENWDLGISYDINTSSLVNASNSKGAFELSLIYVHPEEKRRSVKCPKF